MTAYEDLALRGLKERLAYLTRMIDLRKAEEERLAKTRQELEAKREKIASFIEMYGRYIVVFPNSPESAERDRP